MAVGNLSPMQFGNTQPAQAQQATAPNPTANLFTQVPALPGPPQALNMAPTHPPHYATHVGDAGSPPAIKGADPTPAMVEEPLPGMSNSFGSVKTAAAWRKPRGVLPLGKGTFGSVFQPFGD